MTTVKSHRVSPRRRPPSRKRRLDLVSLAVLFVSVVAIVLVLVGVVERGSSPFFVIPPTVLGFVAILGLTR